MQGRRVDILRRKVTSAEKNFIERIKAPIFLGEVLAIEINIRAPIQFRRQSQPQHLKMWFFLKNKPIHFHINSTSAVRLVKRNQLSFLSIEINKLLLTLVHSVSLIRFKFRIQFQLLLQIRCLIALRISQISTDANITDEIIRKVINVQQKKFMSQRWSLEELPSINKRSHLLLTKEEIRQQGSTITIKSPYVITCVCNILAYVTCVGKYQKAYIRRHTFYLVKFASYLNRMKNC